MYLVPVDQSQNLQANCNSRTRKQIKNLQMKQLERGKYTKKTFVCLVLT